MNDASTVFRGFVVARKPLPQRAEMKGRGRYAVTFRVDEYWKGSPGSSVILYGVDAGTDCLGDGGFEVGKNYLVYAAEMPARDVFMGDVFWYGWTDVLPVGTQMLVPQTACMPGGETSKVQKALGELGKGRSPVRTP